ncbi:acyltransferase [Deinococcus sp. KNUC1210]|uniref:acyltransferase family protein n=1 Tax=Deinococcus sp. KNUC1210 TaxID=2917691 RepID=UPI001EF0C86E|nr:acyltransferase [Deinococcus sp. KNUC1210]ULH15977.1 acyltransferase [Deinococcus sp. KNUC1210]
MVLDSLRGLAALTVMVHHYLLTFPSIYPYGQEDAPVLVKLFQFSPLHLVWAGYEAVLLFFVLSGFVLSLPVINGKITDYGSFVIKRWTRIWIPYIVVVSVAGLANLLVGHLEVAGMSTWFRGAWQGMNWEGYLNHILLIGDLDRFSAQFIPVVWSLRYEMLASLAFPLLLFLSRSLSWPVIVLVGLILNLLGNLYQGSLKPFQFLLMFLVGILLARHQVKLIQIFRSFPRSSHVPVLALSVGLYICAWLGWHPSRSPVENTLLDWGITLAAALAIIIALSSKTAYNLLTWRPIEWVGRISYSIYLTHTLVMLVVVHVFGNIVPVWLLLIACVPLTLLLSHYTYLWVERPAMRLGKSWTLRQPSQTDSL